MKEVYFNYCEMCIYWKHKEGEDPCDMCLQTPCREDSHRPIFYEEDPTRART